MEFDVGGIKFNKEDLVSIATGDIKSNTLSPSHFFMLLRKSNKAVLLIKAGDYIEASQIREYLEKGLIEVFELAVAKRSEIERLKQFLESYQELQTLDDQQAARKNFLEIIKSQFESPEEYSFLSFSIAFFEHFYSFTEHTIDLYQRVSSVLFTRAIKTSAIGVVSCFVNDYLDYKFIKDFYNTSFIMDYGLVEYGQFNFALAIACEAERKKPGSGILKLRQMKRSEGECQVFLNHPIVSFEYGQDNSESFTYPEVLNFLKFQHENQDGTGFPMGLSYHGMSRFETLLSFHDNMISFKDNPYSRGDLSANLISNFLELDTHPHFQKLAIHDLKTKWSAFIDWLLPKERVA